jgi:hydrogenase 3 maturation protease
VRILKAALKKQLNNAKKIALLGVGSEFRQDDACGMLVAEALKNSCSAAKQCKKLKVFFGATAPENLTGEIKKFNPSHVIIVDAADTGKKAGSITLIKPQEATGISFSTHQLPLSIMVDYLIQSIACEVIIIGIQPKTTNFGSEVSSEVKKSVGVLSSVIQEIICDL